MELRLENRQTQTLSPRLQHAVRMLQMSSLDFATLVRDSLGKNPFLEAVEGASSADGDDDSGDESVDRQAHDEGGRSSTDDQDSGDDRTDESVDTNSDRDLWQNERVGSGAQQASDGDLSAMELMAANTPLNTHLHRQLGLLRLDERELHLARVIVESLDDDGYMRAALESLGGVSDLDPEPTLEELETALRRVQSLEPAGVAARDVGECLMLQLPSLECDEQRRLASVIVGQHLQALAQRDTLGLARKLGVDAARVQAACDRIRRLDPRPGWRVDSTAAAYVVPDVIVRQKRGIWTVTLNPAVVPRVRLNQVYADLFARHRDSTHGEMASHLEEARWTVRNVQQRFSTILDVAEAIVKRQRHFLEFGAMAMKPLGLREIADEVGIHESTVSRVTNNKYMATPIGVFELKYFFSRAMVSSSGKPCSGTAIRGLVKDIIGSESSQSPLSDAAITRQLEAQGLRVARRTVTKYRQMLKIDPVDKRQRLAPSAARSLGM